MKKKVVKKAVKKAVQKIPTDTDAIINKINKRGPGGECFGYVKEALAGCCGITLVRSLAMDVLDRTDVVRWIAYDLAERGQILFSDNTASNRQSWIKEAAFKGPITDNQVHDGNTQVQVYIITKKEFRTLFDDLTTAQQKRVLGIR